MGSVVLDCWEMSVVRYVRLRLYHALLSVNLLLPFIDFSFRTIHGFYSYFILYSLFFIYLILFNSFPPSGRFPTPDERIGV
jgi:hypothetical protein